jgi:ATP-dependent Lhr-like helicase
MIPDEKDYIVIEALNEAPVGILQEAFVAEYAKPGVKFTLRGRPWKILNVHNDKIYVKTEDDPTGAIPSWIGEQIPVPLEVALEVGEIKAFVENSLENGETKQEISDILSEKYSASTETIERAISTLVDHHGLGYPIPTNSRVVLEDWGDNVIIHANFGSLPNRTLSRIIGHIISEETGYPVGVQQDTYMIVTQTVGNINADHVSKMMCNLGTIDLDQIIGKAIVKTGLFKKRLINVARKSGALSKFANFSNITYTLRQDLDLNSVTDILKKMSTGEIQVTTIENKGILSPLSEMGLSSISLKSDIVPPEQISRVILESAKTRLLNETRTFACLGKKYWLQSFKIKDLPEKLVCPRCGSTEIGVFNQELEKVAELQALDRQRTKKKLPVWWERGKDTSKLISIYGRRAAIIATAKNVNLTTAWDILAETIEETDQYYESILEAERTALKKRFA